MTLAEERATRGGTELDAAEIGAAVAGAVAQPALAALPERRAAGRGSHRPTRLGFEQTAVSGAAARESAKA